MNKLVLYSLLFFFASAAQALSVDLESDDFAMVGRDFFGVNFDLFSQQNGNAKSESSAVKVYMPWKIPTVSPATTHYKTSDLGDSTSINGGVIFDLELENDDRTDLELFVAIKTGSTTNYKVVAQLSESTPFVSLAKICAESTDLDCTSLDANSYGNNVEKNTYFYVFYVDEEENFLVGTEFDPSADAANNGVFFHMYFSNKLTTFNTVSPTTVVSSQVIERGDQNLFVTLEGKIGDASVTRTGIFGGKSSDAPDEDTFYQLYNSANENGRLTISKLSNDTEYCFVGRYINFYGFKSATNAVLSSNCKTPIAIEQLLKEKSCFLVTAGFQRDHFVLDYFRNFRDTTLVKSELGRKFIRFYYSLAPNYAKYIYTSPILSQIVRSISYFIYYVMKNFLVVLVLSLSIIPLFYLRFYSGKKNFNC